MFWYTMSSSGLRFRNLEGKGPASHHTLQDLNIPEYAVVVQGAMPPSQRSGHTRHRAVQKRDVRPGRCCDRQAHLMACSTPTSRNSALPA